MKHVWYGVYSQIQMRDCRFYIVDGGSNELEVSVGEGNLTFDENRPLEYKPNRGVLDEVRFADEAPMSVSFDFKYESYTSSTGVTPSDALKGTGTASGWVSSDSDLCRPYAVDLVIVHDPVPGCGTSETITLPDYRWEKLSFDPKAGTISSSGNCNATVATVTTSADTPS
jgi:hypothetical protein